MCKTVFCEELKHSGVEGGKIGHVRNQYKNSKIKKIIIKSTKIVW